MKAIYLIAAGLCLLALAPMPYGYYTFLRIVVTITAIIIIKNEWNAGANFWVVAFGITGVLFNPVIPIYLYQRSKWMPIDIGVAVLFVVYALFSRSIKSDDKIIKDENK